MTLITRTKVKNPAPVTCRVPVRLPGSMTDAMKSHYRAKEKSRWVSDALVDLLNRDCFVEADWTSGSNEDADMFLSLLSFRERLQRSKTEQFLFPEEVCRALDEAESLISSYKPSVKQWVRSSLIRAAIRQRLLLNGLRWDEAFPREDD